MIKLKYTKLIAAFTLSFLFAFSSKSQHCIFDVYSIIVVKVHSATDTNNIPNLKITLINNNLKTNDTLFFFQNPNKLKFEHIANHKQYNFPFAKDNYCLVCKNNVTTENYSLKIEDIDGVNNGGEFKTAIIHIYEIDKYPLCGRYDKTTYQDLNHSNLGRVYKPLEVILYRTKQQNE
jgi:hypothetical protein